MWLRVCASDDARSIRKQVTKRKIEYKENGARQMQRIEFEQIDDDRYSELLWNFCIVNWEGFVDKNGEIIACTTENKILLMRRSIKFARFVAAKLELLAEVNGDQQEALEKNS